MSNVKEYSEYFKWFNTAIKNLKEGKYSGFTYSSGTPRRGNTADSSTAGDIASSYIMKASKEFVHKRRHEIMKNALKMMKEDRNYSQDKKETDE